MSGRSGVGQTRGATLGPQPLKATIPYQLHSKPRANWREGKSHIYSTEKTRSHQLSSGMRRTVSLDAIIGPYLQGHWPKEPEGQQGSPSWKDKSTQTPESWSDRSQSRRSGSGHKRSASWGSAEHLREIAKLKQQLQQRTKPGVSGGHDKDRQCSYPRESCSPGTTQTQPVSIPLTPLSRLAPRLRCSVEGLNQELEGMFICQLPPHQHRLHEVPDGHRAPLPPQSCSSGSQSDPSTTPLSHTCSSSSSSSSPCSSPPFLTASPPNSEDLTVDLDQGLTDSAELCLLSPFSPHGEADTSLPLLLASSPRPNKSCCFQREPPEGCEKVRVWDETSAPHYPKPSFSSCPDPNKINFTPHGGSAFCPVSLLLPSMDLLFRNLGVSPANGCSGQGSASSSNLGPLPAAPAVGEGSGERLAF
ncbi:protein FAM117A-like [Diretmus argenteus]